jgi:hypothetical protein
MRKKETSVFEHHHEYVPILLKPIMVIHDTISWLQVILSDRHHHPTSTLWLQTMRNLNLGRQINPIAGAKPSL